MTKKEKEKQRLILELSSLVKSSIEFARLAESDPEDLDILYKQLKKVERALKKSNTVLNRQDTCGS